MTTPLPSLCVWPSPLVRGWDGTSDPPALYDIRSGLEALEARYDVDAHAPGYVIPGETRQPRVRKAAIQGLIERGAEPVMW